MKKVVILGSTGSIGTQALNVCRQRSYQVVVLTAYTNVELLERQAREFSPWRVVIGDEGKYLDLKARLADTTIEVLAGVSAMIETIALAEADIVLNAIVGIAGLRPTLAALESGKDVALANKEALITGGELVISAAKNNNAKIYPVDSEHSAIWQSLQGSRREDLRSVILTASGGPFFGKTKDELKEVTIKEALAHPNWSMGAKITIDSATLMNKGLEFIEAMWFFDVTPEQIEIIVHRESVLHSAVDFKDGSVIGQMGVPTMEVAIQYALSYPERPTLTTKRLSLTDYGSLTFYKPDFDTFTCLATCIRAAKKGGLTACVANGANEEAVRLFLDNKIKFLKIGELVASATEHVKPKAEVTLNNIEEADTLAREFVLAHYE